MAKWTDEELAELEDPDTWDWESAEVHPPVENPGARVSVRFTAAELGVVERAAEQAGMKLTAYIRAAALAHAQTGAPPQPPGSSRTQA
jgi:hypothetical protein